MSALKKTGYFGAVITVSLICVFLYLAFFNIESEKSSPSHAALALAPNTAQEQQALIEAQEEQAAAHEISSGPLIARTTVPQAQDRVLNIKNTPAQS